jgi:hypothetical protein
MAALFDALMFLSVMSVVSVTVLVAFYPGHDIDGNAQSYVQKCHRVLLGTTLRSWSESSERLMSVSDAIATLLFLKKPLPERIHAEIDALLIGMLQPQYIATWRCSTADSSYRFGADIINATGGDVFVSTMTVPTPSGICNYSLTVRYA